MPLASVVAVPMLTPSTVNPTFAPETAAPPEVRVSVAESDTGPAEPKPTLAGDGAASASDVAMELTPTTSVPVVVGPVPLPWQVDARVARMVNVYVPFGVRPATGPVFVVCRVSVRVKSAFVAAIGFPPPNDAVTPTGRAPIVSSVIVQATELPPMSTSTE